MTIICALFQPSLTAVWMDTLRLSKVVNLAKSTSFVLFLNLSQTGGTSAFSMILAFVILKYVVHLFVRRRPEVLALSQQCTKNPQKSKKTRLSKILPRRQLYKKNHTFLYLSFPKETISFNIHVSFNLTPMHEIMYHPNQFLTPAAQYILFTIFKMTLVVHSDIYS